MNFLDIYKKVDELLQITLGDALVVPVDVDKIAENLNISVVEQSLGYGNSNNKYISSSFYTNDEFVCLLSNDFSKLEQRFALAREIARNVLFEKKCNFDGCSYLTNPQYFIDEKEIMIDMFANFMLMPPHLLIQKYDEFMAAQSDYISLKNWLKYVSVMFKVSYEQAVAGYYQTRNLCACLSDLKEEEQKEDAVQKVISIKKN